MRSQAAAVAQGVLWCAKRSKRENSHNCKGIWFYHHSFMSPKCPIKTDCQFSRKSFSLQEVSLRISHYVAGRETQKWFYQTHFHKCKGGEHLHRLKLRFISLSFGTSLKNQRSLFVQRSLHSHEKCHTRRTWWPPWGNARSSALATKLVWDDCNLNSPWWAGEMNLSLWLQYWFAPREADEQHR